MKFFCNKAELEYSEITTPSGYQLIESMSISARSIDFQKSKCQIKDFYKLLSLVYCS